MERVEYDLVVIGGGVVGLWTALLAARGGLSVALVERNDRLGAMTSSRNSGVLHGGLYYPPDTLKSFHCVRGRRLSVAFLREQGVPFSICGKYIVPIPTEEASGVDTAPPDADEQLERLKERALANGVEDISLVRADQPFLLSRWALHVGCTGIVDLPAYMTVLEREVRRVGVTVYLNRTCFAAEAGSVVTWGSDSALPEERGLTLAAPCIVNAAGLYADTVAGMFGLTGFEVRPNKGTYFRLRFPLPVQTLIYPLPSAHSTFLGVHYTPDLAGNAWVGPNSTAATDKADFAPDADRTAFHASLSRIVRGYAVDDLTGPHKVGLRARLFENGEACSDFVIREHPAGVCHCLGIESPGLTAAPSLARDVLTRLGIVPPGA